MSTPSFLFYYPYATLSVSIETTVHRLLNSSSSNKTQNFTYLFPSSVIQLQQQASASVDARPKHFSLQAARAQIPTHRAQWLVKKKRQRVFTDLDELDS